MEQMQLVKESIKREYELTYLITGDLLDADVAKIRKEVIDLIAKFKGKVLEENDWERKLLAYKIRHAGKAHGEAIFTHLLLELSPSKIQKLDKEITLHNQVMRHLLVSKEDEILSDKKTVKSEVKDKKEDKE
jgi:small subunit ribosomal protein S6